MFNIISNTVAERIDYENFEGKHFWVHRIVEDTDLLIGFEPIGGLSWVDNDRYCPVDEGVYCLYPLDEQIVVKKDLPLYPVIEILSF
ncbi:MAG: hypothetical protein NC820_07010 [Candidatus Omnitrophica bacterium]|nr:hypothetical protein [Candidatus Omnitrophota bacterium]